MFEELKKDLHPSVRTEEETIYQLAGLSDYLVRSLMKKGRCLQPILKDGKIVFIERLRSVPHSENIPQALVESYVRGNCETAESVANGSLRYLAKLIEDEISKETKKQEAIVRGGLRYRKLDDFNSFGD